VLEAEGITDRSFTVRNLDYGQVYWFKVRAVTPEGIAGEFAEAAFAVPWISLQGVQTLADIRVPYGTDSSEIGLPKLVRVTLADDSTREVPVIWDGGTPAYDRYRPGTYIFTGTPDLPDYIRNDQKRLKAEIRVIMSGLPHVGDSPVRSVTIRATLKTASGKEVNADIVIIRTRENGAVRDQVTLTPESMRGAWPAILESGENAVRVILPDERDEVTETFVRIPAETIRQFREADVDLEIHTENVRVRIPASSLAGIEDDLYFKIVSVREQSGREELAERARAGQAVVAVARGQSVEVSGRPVTIETNLQNRPVILMLPLNGAEPAGDPAEREDDLANLAIYVEHSDGGSEVIMPQAAEYGPGMPGLQFAVNRFSTFAILAIDGQQGQAEARVHQAYMKGYADGTFRPDRTVTRAEMAAILARNLGFDGTGSGAGSFADVEAAHWASNEIGFVKERGLMTGDEQGNFRPDAPISRGEMAAIAARYKRLDTSGVVKPSFADVEESHWAFGFIEAAKAAGILSGYPDGTFRPQGQLTRAEAVTIINRLFERGPLHGVTQPSWPDVPASHWAFAEIEEASRDHQYTLLPGGGEKLNE
jgi:hypothetical protein